MMKKVIISIAFLSFICFGVFALYLNAKISKLPTVEVFNLEDRKKYNEVLGKRYSVLNNMPYDCNWGKLDFSDGVLETYDGFNAPIYSYEQDDVVLQNVAEHSVTWYESGYELPAYWANGNIKAIEDFISEVQLPESFFYDEVPEVQFREIETQSYTKIPFYEEIDDIKIYSNEFLMWEDRGKNRFQIVTNYGEDSLSRIISISNENNWEVNLIDSEKIVDYMIANPKNMFIAILSSELYSFCRGDQLKSIHVEEMDIIYTRVSENYLYPLVKMKGIIQNGREMLDFSIIADLTDPYEKKNIYIESLENGKYDYFVPGAEITSISQNEELYIVEGYAASDQYVHSISSLGKVDELLGYDANVWEQASIDTVLLRLFMQYENERRINEFIRDSLYYDSNTGHFTASFPMDLLVGESEVQFVPQLCVKVSDSELKYSDFVNNLYIAEIDESLYLCSFVDMENANYYDLNNFSERN